MADELVDVERECPRCHKISTLSGISLAALNAWRNGALIQNVFPDLSLDEREILITGFHSECWDAEFGYDE